MFAAALQKHIRYFWETKIIRATRFHADNQVHTVLTQNKNFPSTAIINISEDDLRTGNRNVTLNTKQ